MAAHLLRYRGLNGITRPAVEPLPHMDALPVFDGGTRGSRFVTTRLLSSIDGVVKLSPAAGAVLGPVGHEPPVSAGPVGVEHSPVWSASLRGLRSSHHDGCSCAP